MMRHFITLVEAGPPVERKKRVSDAEFIRLAQEKLGGKAGHMTLPDMAAFADENGIQIPTTIRHNKDLKTDAHHWNLSGRAPEDANVDKAVAKDLGVDVEQPSTEDDVETRLANVKKVRGMVATGKVYLFGRKPKGAFFRIQGADEMLATLERAFARELSSQGDSTMEAQYEDLRDRVELVGSGRSSRLKSLLITGAPRSGKALALDTPIPTPTGWTTMGELSVGDVIYDDRGELCHVTFATPVQYDRKCYELVFDNGIRIVADEDHRWHTTTRASRRSEQRAKKRLAERNGVLSPLPHGTDQTHKRVLHGVKTTAEIAQTLHDCDDWHLNHQIPCTFPIEGTTTDEDLPIRPYVLGLWLGDGDSSSAILTCGVHDIEQLKENLITEEFEFKTTLTPRNVWRIQLSNGYGGPMKEKLRYKLRQLDVLNNKHIPAMYLRASVKARAELLKGLMDTDGTISAVGECEFCVVNERLARDTHELISSLGINATFTTCQISGTTDSGSRCRIHFTTDQKVFRLPRKLDRLKTKVRKSDVITIAECNPVDSVPVRCITVDSPSSLFLCSRGFVPTHNTTTVIKTLEDMGYKEDREFGVQKGKSTPTALYRSLIQRIHGLTIFDDCDSVITNEDGVNMLKNALDSGDIRDVGYDNPKATINVAVLPREERNQYNDIISKLLNAQDVNDEEYQFIRSVLMRLRVFKLATRGLKKKKPEEIMFNPDAEEGGDEDEGDWDADEQDYVLSYVTKMLPNKIDFDGRIIFISNLELDDWPDAIVQRAFTQNLNFRDDEMIEYIDRIKNNIPMGIDNEQKQEVWDFVKDLWRTGKLKSRVSFGLAFEAFDLRLTNNWQRKVANL